MNNIFLLAKRELGYYLNTIWGYAILAIILVIDGILFNTFAMGANTERYSTDVLQDFFFFSSGTTMIAGVLIAMRLLAEERSNGTSALLETAPISEAQIIAGKYLGAFGFLSIIILCTLYMPFLIEINGKVSWAHIGAGYLGLLLLGGTSVAIGTFSSAIAKNQIFASLLGASILVLLLLGGLLGKTTEPPLADIFSYTALFDRHYQPFMRGRINSESIFFYLSTSFVFLLLSTRILQSRRIS